MSIRFNHTIVHSRAKEESARFLADVLGSQFGSQHCAFIIDESDLDRTFGRIQEQRLDYRADPFEKRPRETRQLENRGLPRRGSWRSLRRDRRRS